jgi:hypothetical protein
MIGLLRTPPQQKDLILATANINLKSISLFVLPPPILSFLCANPADTHIRSSPKIPIYKSTIPKMIPAINNSTPVVIARRYDEAIPIQQFINSSNSSHFRQFSQFSHFFNNFHPCPDPSVLSCFLSIPSGNGSHP